MTLVERAVEFLNKPEVKNAPYPVHMKLDFLREKGLTETEILEALNIAGQGELLNQV